jgi:LmbE family N-acetylglucosaminyl deacetylase/ActR/RegA family two-component response regulator
MDGSLMDGSQEASATSRSRVLLVEDDEVFADAVMEIVRPLAEVKWTATAERALDELPSEDWDLVITDVNLPGMSGLEFALESKRACPLSAILVLTGNADVDTAVGALRANADDFLTKPVDPVTLTVKVTDLIAMSRKRKLEHREVVLAIGAHPDDVEIGCGGILLRHASLGDDVNVLTLTGGEVGGAISERIVESQHAAELLSARLFQAELADTSLSVSDGGIMIGTIERVIAEIQPTTVYTHSHHDVHQDHRNVHNATLVAARRVPRLYCYQAPSGSVDFHPTRFVGIDEWVERKIEVIGAYGSQIKVRRYLQEDLLRATARYWSRFGNSRYAEPLEVIRDSEVTPVPVQSASEEPHAVATATTSEKPGTVMANAHTTETKAIARMTDINVT